MNIGIRWRLLLTITPLIILIFILLTYFAYDKIQVLSRIKTDDEAILTIKNESQLIFRILDKASIDTRTIGELITTVQNSKNKDRELMGSLLKDFLGKNREYQGIWIVYEPQAFDGRDQEFVGHPYSDDAGSLAMYWYLGSTGQVEVTGVNVREETFYTIPKQNKMLTLIEPYIDPAAHPPVLMTTVTQPIMKDGRVLAILGIDIALDKLSTLIAKVRPFEKGYAMLFTDTGSIVASPKTEDVGKNLREVSPTLFTALNSSLRTGRQLQTTLKLDKIDWRLTAIPVTLLPNAPAWSFTLILPEAAVMAEATSSLYNFLIIGLGGIIVITLTILIGANMVGKPLTVLSTYATAVANGNLNLKLDRTNFKDEIAILGTAIASMVSELLTQISEATATSKHAQLKSEEAAQATLLAQKSQALAETAKQEGMLHAAAQLETIVQVLYSASNQLSTQIMQSEKGAIEQANRAQETVTAMAQMNNTVQDVTHKANISAENVITTKQKAETGAVIVREVVTSIEQVQKDSLTLKTDMETLSVHAQSISQVMNVISDIADQTNLLALNAAIEAARAGEAGRGFAVVADEVRKLAEKTMTSTSQVGSAIKAIQDSTTQSSKQVDATVQNIEKTTNLASHSGQALSEIVTLVDAAVTQVKSIAATSEQQSVASTKINRSIEQVNSIASETVQTMRAASQTVSDLAAQAKSLTELIEQMKHNSSS